MSTKADVIRVMAVMAKAYPNYAPKEGTSEVYYMILSDIPKDVLEAGAKVCLARATGFFPSAGEWRQAALDIQISKMGMPSALEAWGEVLQAFDSVGSYKEPEFSTPLIDHVVKSFGWKNLCASSDQMVDRAHFLKAYEAQMSRSLEDAKMLPDVKAVSEKYKLGEANKMIKQLTEGWAK